MLVHIRNAAKFGVPTVVCINVCATDTQSELDAVVAAAASVGVKAVPSRHWSLGGAGAVDLANAVIEACAQQSNFKFLYALDLPIADKIRTIAREIYGATDIDLSEKAVEQMERYTASGYGGLPICMAKTQYSLSHDPNVRGVPGPFVLPIREIRASVGAGFLYPLVGAMSTIPGLPTRPAFFDVDVDPDTNSVQGLF
jgi:formyltetrahydrofolate synthetase